MLSAAGINAAMLQFQGRPRNVCALALQHCLDALLLLAAGEIPRGALYVGTNERIEGGFKHCDQFFLVPAIEQGNATPYDTHCSSHERREDNSATPLTESQSNPTGKREVDILWLLYEYDFGM